MRGYLVAMAVAYLVREDDIGLLPRIDVGDRTFTGVLVLVGFVIASIWLGRRWRNLPRVPQVALGVGAALLMLPAIVSLFEADEYAQRDPYQGASDYYTVDSVYAFDEQGRPLFNARIFDQSGNPVQGGLWGCVDANGVIVAEVFPKCADPQPLGWPQAFLLPQVQQEAAEATPTPTPTPSATALTPTPSATAPTPTPSATAATPTPSPTLAPSATR
jgi:hypothetical protein